MRRACVGALLLAAALGCGRRDRGEVEGVVKLDGEPIEQGGITFFPSGDTRGPSTGGTISQGKYRIADGVVLGSNKVEIRAAGKTGRKVASARDPKLLLDEYAEVVPARYNVKSELVVQVKPGTNALDFDLKK